MNSIELGHGECCCAGCCAHEANCVRLADSGKTDESGNPICIQCLPHTFTGAQGTGCDGVCGPYAHPYFESHEADNEE